MNVAHSIVWWPVVNDQFWSSFWPEAAAGLVTGLVVGAAIFWSESLSDRRREVRESLRAWQSVRPTIERAILSSGAFSAQHIAISGFGRIEIERVMADKPLGRWIEDLKFPELEALARFLSASREFELAGREFDLRISPLVASASADTRTREEIARRLRLKSHHARPEVMEALLGPQRPQVIAAADEIFHDPQVSHAHESHHSALTELATSRAALITSLGLEQPVQAPLTFLGRESTVPSHRRAAVPQRNPWQGVGRLAGHRSRAARRLRQK